MILKTKSDLLIKESSLPGVLVIESDTVTDRRGNFTYVYDYDAYARRGLTRVFVQDIFIHSHKNVLFGLCYQRYNQQAKLIITVDGNIFDVAVDIRLGSPNFGKWQGMYLSSLINRQVFIPEGFAHGYCVLSETAEVIIKCTECYDDSLECGINWADSVINIEWPVKEPILSNKDACKPSLYKIPSSLLPVFIQ